jgi:hypothetical protein
LSAAPSESRPANGQVPEPSGGSKLHQLLEKVDADLAQEVRQRAVFCREAASLILIANLRRPQWDRRYSFCCAQED